MKFQIIKSNVLILIVGVSLGFLLMAGDGYIDIVKDNMIEYGLTPEEADNILKLPDAIEKVFIAEEEKAFVPPCTLRIISNDGMSGYALIVKDTVEAIKIFNLWEKIKKTGN